MKTRLESTRLESWPTGYIAKLVEDVITIVARGGYGGKDITVNDIVRTLRGSTSCWNINPSGRRWKISEQLVREVLIEIGADLYDDGNAHRVRKPTQQTGAAR